jgi:hypothetical protein
MNVTSLLSLLVLGSTLSGCMGAPIDGVTVVEQALGVMQQGVDRAGAFSAAEATKLVGGSNCGLRLGMGGGLNPGGSHSEPDQWHREDGAHDYRDGYRTREIAALRPGGLKLRQQLGAMVAWLGIDWQQTLSLNLVPFRSARWDAMPADWRSASLEFATLSFWPLLLTHRTPRLILVFGDASARTLRGILDHPRPRRYSVEWGKVTADVSDSNATAIVRLPHLSTFRIFGRLNGAGVAALEMLRNDPGLRRAFGEGYRLTGRR